MIRRPAMTLVELLVALMLIGLVTAAVHVTAGGGSPELRVAAAAELVESVCQRAAFEAQSRRQIVFVELDCARSRVRVAPQVDSDRIGVWRSLNADIVLPPARGEPELITRIRVGPSGCSEPWRFTLRAGTVERVLEVDGLRQRIHAAQE